MVERQAAPLPEGRPVTDRPIDLDSHRGMMAQSDTEARRHTAEVEADEAVLRHDRDELERLLFAGPAANWEQAATKLRYLLALFAATDVGRQSRYVALVEAALDDMTRLLGKPE